MENPADFLSRHPMQSNTRFERNIADEYVNYLRSNAVPKSMSVNEIKKAIENDASMQTLIKAINSGRWDYKKKICNRTNIADEYVNYLMSNAVPKSMSVNEIKTATENDAGMQTLIKAINSGGWDYKKKDLQPYNKIRNELVTSENLVLRGTHIIIPHSLCNQVLNLAHEGHQGIAKTKRLLRQKVWYPNIDRDAEDIIKNCIPCIANSSAPKPEPLQMSDLP